MEFFILNEEEEKKEDKGKKIEKFENEEKFWEALKKGFEVEKEHGDTVGKDNFIDFAKITLDHLKEKLDYYDLLEKVEGNVSKTEEEKKDNEEKEDEEK